MSDWLSWEEVAKELELRDFELLEYFSKGLQPYSPKGGEKIYCPSEHHRYFQISSLRFKKIGPEIIRQKGFENPDKQRIEELKQFKMSGPRMEIIGHLRRMGVPRSSKEISEAVGKNYSTTRVLISKMVAEGQLIQPEEGIYYINNINT